MALKKISIPEGPNNHFILMESMRDQWIIYDLGMQGVIFESDDFETVLTKWDDFGFPEMKFANATNLSDYFQETEESKEKNKMNWNETFWLLALFIFYLHWKFWMAVSFGFILILVVYIHERYSSSPSKSHCSTS